MKNQNKIKSAYDEKRTILGEVLPIDTPYRIQLDISEVCNLKCNYCFRGHGYESYGYALKNNLMSMEVFKKAVSQLKQFPNKVKAIALTGSGEPLCNKNLPDMVKYLKHEYDDVFVDTTTNAVLLTEEYALEIAQSNIDRITVSIQGITSNKYKAVCGKEVNIDNFIKNLKILYDNAINTKIYIKIVDVALEEGEDVLFYKMFQDVAHFLSIDKVIDIWIDTTSEKETNLMENNRFGEKLEYQNVCAQSFFALIVSPDGDIYPCCNPLAPIKFGNISDISLLDGWNSTTRINFLKKQLTKGRKEIKICKECNFAQDIRTKKFDSLNGYENDILVRIKEQ